MTSLAGFSLRPCPASRLLAAVLTANVLTLAGCNLAGAPTAALPLIYPCLVILCGFGFAAAVPKAVPWKVTPGMVWWVLIFWAGLSAARLPYVLEWLPGNSVYACWDDRPRLAGLVSMTLSERFPLRHFANQSYLYSYYYCAMIPWAVIKLALPALTLKDALFLGHSLYYLLILFSLLETANQFLPSRRSLWVFLFLGTVFGGLDWIPSVWLTGAVLIAHHEWWQLNEWLHGYAQVSSFFTALLWTCHHFLGFYALVLACFFATRFRFGRPALKSVATGLLLISGFYSSIFAFVPAVLFGLAHARPPLRRFCRPQVLPVLLVVFLAPVFLYTRKPPFIRFIPAGFRIEFTGNMAADKLLSFPLWLAIVPLVEFALIPWADLAMRRRFSATEKRYFAAAGLFFLLTYVVAVTRWNNFAMRGMFLPSFVFFILFAKYAPARFGSLSRLSPAVARVGCAAVAALLAFGTVLETLNAARTVLLNMSLTHEIRTGAVPADRFPVIYRDAARDRSSRYFREPPGRRELRSFNAEKLLDVTLEQMTVGDLEQISFTDPDRPWRRRRDAPPP